MQFLFIKYSLNPLSSIFNSIHFLRLEIICQGDSNTLNRIKKHQELHKMPCGLLWEKCIANDMSWIGIFSNVPEGLFSSFPRCFPPRVSLAFGYRNFSTKKGLRRCIYLSSSIHSAKSWSYSWIGKYKQTGDMNLRGIRVNPSSHEFTSFALMDNVLTQFRILCLFAVNKPLEKSAADSFEVSVLLLVGCLVKQEKGRIKAKRSQWE